MNRTFILFISFIFVFILAGDPVLLAQDINIFNPSLLPDSQVYSYTWYKQERPIGKTVYSLQKKENGNFFVEKSGLDNAKIELNGFDLKPVLSENTVKLDNNQYLVKSEFNGSSIKVHSHLPTGEKSQIIPIVSNVYHDDALVINLMAMDMKPGHSIEFKHYNPANGQIANYKVAVVSEEIIKIPAGTFETYRLKLIYGNGMSVNEAWYDKKYPHRLVQYSNPEALSIAKLDNNNLQ